MINRVSTVVFVQMAGSKTSKGTGGGLIFQEALASSLIERGLNVYAITNPSDTYGFQFLEKNRLVARYTASSTGSVGLLFFDSRKLKAELRSAISDLPNDAIFVTIDPFPADILAAKVLKRSGRRAVVTMYHITPSPMFHPFRRGPFRSIIAWLISLNALLFVKLYQVPLFLDNRRIASEMGWQFSRNLLEMPLALPSYSMNKVKGGKKYACFLGRLAKNKGILDLIRAWRMVRSQVPDALLYIMGRDFGNGRYQKLIRRYRLQDSVVITDFLDEKAKEEIMDECSLFIFPSYEEGWGLAVMEAIDMGLLPIVYDLPAYDYMCSSENKVRVSDVRSLASKVAYYFTHDEERSELVKKLQGCISGFTINRVTDVWLDQVNNYFFEV